MDDDELRDAAAKAQAFLETVAADRTRLVALPEATRRAIAQAAGAFLYPDPQQKRALAKAFRRRERDDRRQADEAVLERTGIRALRSQAVFPTPLPASQLVPLPPIAGADTGPAPGSETEAGSEATARPEAGPAPRAGSAANPGGAASGPEVLEVRKCYVCKTAYRSVHPFYDQLCPPCGDFNFAKRSPTADLRGRTALVTGARVKIGYHAAILLLRAGARVLVTTRFPVDAAERFAREPDFEDFRGRLRVFGLDLRHTPSVEAFCHELLTDEPRLDFVIHNACQTVRRPAGFYAHLMEGELRPREALPAGAADLLGVPGSGLARLEPSSTVGRTHSAVLSQLALLDEDRLAGGALFPVGELDADLQQRDLRPTNSWRMRLADVSTVELLEVQLVNAIAPFVINARLKPLMLRTPERDKHIVNVSAMEGQFYRTHKTDKHPHTNMAKAALNMMTRTSAADFARDGIHMNSVDTGWVTDEDAAQLAERKREEHGFHPPLDVVDGAARIVDPIFHGANTGEHHYGLFLKDYKPIPW